MIAADSSSFIAFLAGEQAPDTYALKNAIITSKLYLPFIVATELISDPVIGKNVEIHIKELPLLEIFPEGFWIRAGKTRSILLKKGLKAKIADTLIAQCCIEYKVPLITRDKDFRHYAKHCGLKLYDA